MGERLEVIMGIGTNIREIRKLKRFSLKELAKKTEYSVSYLSQIENEKANPSVTSLIRISDALGIQVASLFNGSDIENLREQQYIVREGHYRHLENISEKNQYFFLSPLQKQQVQSMIIMAEPDGYSSIEFDTHKGIDCGYILEGQLEMTLGTETYLLEKGDYIQFAGDIPHKWRNPGEKKSVSFWSVINLESI